MAILIKEIDSVKSKVERILFSVKEANESDDFLYWLICQEVADDNGYNIDNIKASVFFSSCRSWGFPGYETVRRARQKLQEQYPELKTNTHSRAESEKNFRAFAREKNNG